MIFTRINQIQNTKTRHVARAAVRAHLIFLKLVLLKTIIFNIAGLKAVVAGSAVLMGILHMIPHVEVVDAATPQSIDMSVSNTVYPVVTDTQEINVYMLYVQSETPNGDPENVTVTATIPVGTTFDSASISPSSIGANIVTWNLPSNNNTHTMILLRLLVNPDAQGTLSSVATVSANNPDPYTSNNTATASIIVGNDGGTMGDVDLFVTKNVDKSQAAVTDELTYTITYGNNGADIASNTKIYDIIPSNMYVISASPEPTGTTGAKDNILVWDMSNLPGGVGGNITITASLYPLLDEGDKIQNNVVIDSDVYESNFDNNVATTNTDIIEGTSQLYATIAGPQTQICSGDTIEFIINFGNQGSADANNVTITNQIPSALQYLYSSEPYSSSTGSKFTRNIVGQLFPGDKGSFTVTTKAVSAGIGVTNIVVANEQGQPVATGAFSLNILTPEVCGYTQNYSGSDKNKEPIPSPISGCTDSTANNYNPSATQNNGTCTYTQTPGVDNYTVSFDTANPLINNPVDISIQLIPYDNTPTSYTKNLTIALQKKSGTTWTTADVSDYALTVPTVSTTFLKSTSWNKTWTDALTLRKSGEYRVKVVESSNSNALGYGYLTVATTQVVTTTTTGATTGTKNPTYITGTNINTGSTGNIANTRKQLDPNTIDLPLPTPTPSIPQTDRPASKPIRRNPVSNPNNPYVRRNPGQTTIEKKNKETLREEIKKTTDEYKTAPVTCEDAYREVFAYAKAIKLTNARSLEEFRPCDPLARIDALKVFVLWLMDSGLVEPSLNGSMTYDDITTLTNEQQFYANLARDFRLIGNGPKLRPLEDITIQDTALIVTKMMFGSDFIKSPSTQYTNALSLMDRAKLMRNTDKGGEAISKGELFTILYRADFGEVAQSSRYIRMLPQNKDTIKVK